MGFAHYDFVSRTDKSGGIKIVFPLKQAGGGAKQLDSLVNELKQDTR
ncbi:MAG: hypothetical protein JWL77_4687 [Chthonomonadaceae bacterium]|nr:hypothetical protein [Chthonomonadaceae bacterium]